MFLPHPRVKVSIVGSLRDREVACSASDCQGSYFESCVWRTVSSESSHHPQVVLLAQFSLHVHKARFISFPSSTFPFFASSSPFSASPMPFSANLSTFTAFPFNLLTPHRHHAFSSLSNASPSFFSAYSIPSH